MRYENSMLLVEAITPQQLEVLVLDQAVGEVSAAYLPHSSSLRSCPGLGCRGGDCGLPIMLQ